MSNLRVAGLRYSGLLLFLIISMLLCETSRSSEATKPDKQTAPAMTKNDIIHLDTGLKISRSDLLDMLTSSKVVYVGETHDNYSIHNVQLEIIRELHRKSPGRIAVGMEMFQVGSQDKLDDWLSGKISEKRFLKDVWYPNWGFEYEYYRQIMEFVKDNKIPVLALNANESTVRKINQTGIDALSDNAKAELPEIDTTDRYHRMRVKAVYDAHKHSSESGFEGFYRIQCLWEETMAQSVVDYLSEEAAQDKQVIVLAGKDHVRYGLGIPKRVFRRMRKPYSIILPIELSIPANKSHNIMNVETVDVPLHEADFLWMVDYTDPVVNKVRLGVVVMPSEKGVVAHDVEKGSSADDIGLKNHDIILEVDGVVIDEPFELVYEIRNKVAGKRGKIKIVRDGSELTLDIVYRLKNEE